MFWKYIKYRFNQIDPSPENILQCFILFWICLSIGIGMLFGATTGIMVGISPIVLLFGAEIYFRIQDEYKKYIDFKESEPNRIIKRLRGDFNEDT